MPGREGASLWERFESREGAEIGVSLITPHLVRQLQKKLYLKAKQDSDSRLCAAGVNCMRLRANPIGEPDAANLHVRFDERGAETEAMVWTATPAFGESCRQQLSPRPNATAPLLDSTAAATRGNDKSGAHRRHGQATHQHCASVRPWHLWVMLSFQGEGFGTFYIWQTIRKTSPPDRGRR